MWSEEQRRFLKGHNWDINAREALIDVLSLPPEDVIGAVRRQFSEAIEVRDLDLVNDVLGVLWSFEVDMGVYLDLVARLFGENWHRHQMVHEWLIRQLQDRADPSTVPILRDAIALKPAVGWEGDYTSDRAFFQRCSHALRAIDTPESLALIEECSYSKNEALRDEALYRLLKIEHGEERLLADPGEGSVPGAGDREIQKRLRDLVYSMSETGGVENVRLVHSLIVEACLLYSARCGYDVYSELLRLVEAPVISFFDIVHGERWFLRLYLFLSVNIRRPIMSPGNRDGLLSTPFYEIEAMLRHAGASARVVHDLFQRAVTKVEQHTLPPIYRRNAHVVNEGYAIADSVDQ